MPGLASTEHLKEKTAPRASCSEQQVRRPRTLWPRPSPRPPQLCPVRQPPLRGHAQAASQSGVLSHSPLKRVIRMRKLAYLNFPKGWPEVQIPGNVGRRCWCSESPPGVHSSSPRTGSLTWPLLPISSLSILSIPRDTTARHLVPSACTELVTIPRRGLPRRITTPVHRGAEMRGRSPALEQPPQPPGQGSGPSVRPWRQRCCLRAQGSWVKPPAKTSPFSYHSYTLIHLLQTLPLIFISGRRNFPFKLWWNTHVLCCAESLSRV